MVVKQLAELALPVIQQQIHGHRLAQKQATKFMRIADFCAKPKPANLPLHLAIGFPSQTPDMIMHPVESSSLRRVGYSEAGRTMKIEFKTGSIWEYLQVPPSEFESLLKAGSAGRYFHAYIRNRFQSRKIL